MLLAFLADGNVTTWLHDDTKLTTPLSSAPTRSHEARRWAKMGSDELAIQAIFSLRFVDICLLGTETQILVMTEEENDHAGKIYVQVLNAATCANIRDAVEFATVAEQKHSFKADGWHAHHVLKRMGHDSDVRPAPKEMGVKKLPWLHTFVSLLRRYLVGTYHGVSPKLLQLYLDEFAFRANRRFGQARILQSLIRACSFAKPATLAELR